MSFDRPAWTGSQDVPHGLPQQKVITIDTGEFIRTRDALTSAYLGLSTNIDRMVKAYLDHTQVVLNGDASLNVSTLLQPFNVLSQYAQTAQLALQQNGRAPVVAASEEPTGKKARKKRAYKARDPNAPKRPLTAYFRYLGEKRAEIQEDMKEHPEKYESSGKPGDITKIATEQWNNLGWAEQEPYREAYRAALKNYEKDVATFKGQGGKIEDLDETKDEEVLQVEAAAEGVVDDDDTSSDSSDSSDDDEKEPTPPPVKKTPKSALKKSKPSDPAPAPVPAPTFSSINEAAPPSSPARKRKAAGDGEQGSKKTRGKKGEQVVAASDPTPVPAAVEPPKPEPASKKKKERKKKTGFE